jgi:D-alanyl-D-alanine carboxypeptidase
MPVLTLDRTEQNKLSASAALKVKYLVAPVAKDQTVGELSVMVDGKPRASVPIRTQAAVARGGFLHRMADRARLMFYLFWPSPRNRFWPVSWADP